MRRLFPNRTRDLFLPISRISHELAVFSLVDDAIYDCQLHKGASVHLQPFQIGLFHIFKISEKHRTIINQHYQTLFLSAWNPIKYSPRSLAPFLDHNRGHHLLHTCASRLYIYGCQLHKVPANHTCGIIDFNLGNSQANFPLLLLIETRFSTVRLSHHD